VCFLEVGIDSHSHLGSKIFIRDHSHPFGFAGILEIRTHSHPFRYDGCQTILEGEGEHLENNRECEKVEGGNSGLTTFCGGVPPRHHHHHFAF